MKLFGTTAIALLLAPFALSAPDPEAAATLPALKAARIIPDVVGDFAPTASLTVKYARETPIKMGEQMLPSEVGVPPKVTFTGADPTKSYTLIMTDPGVLDIKTLRGKEESAWQWLHWIVVNVPGDKAIPAAGLEIQPYGQPAPPAGNHRYTFLLFEQTKPTINPVAPTGRGGFDTRAFATKNGLKAVGGTYFLAQPQTAQ